MTHRASSAAVFLSSLLFISTASATIVQGLSFEDLTDHSEMVVSGQIVRSWAEWDADHHFIWTRYELSVSSVQKGKAISSVVLSEPGGVVGGMGQAIAGTVQYAAGEKV